MAKTNPGVAAYVVLSGFAGELDGKTVYYTTGEPVHPSDPAVAKWPQHFGPLVFPHGVAKAVAPTIAPAEIRAKGEA